MPAALAPTASVFAAATAVAPPPPWSTRRELLAVGAPPVAAVDVACEIARDPGQPGAQQRWVSRPVLKGNRQGVLDDVFRLSPVEQQALREAA